MVRKFRDTVVILICITSACKHQPAPTVVMQPATSLASTASSIDSIRVDGRRFHVRLLGSSGPSVVLISGLGDGLRPWSDVQPAVAQFARVLAYDRPGLGGSEPDTAPRTVGRMTEELHALIPRTGLTPPYTIVGHSLGGFVAQLYAARYPNEVNGVVLVDPSILGFYTSAVALPEWREANDAQTQRMSSASGAVKAEFDAFNRDLDEMRAAPPMPTVPVVLLTATHHGPPAPKPSALDSVWLAEHRLWAAAHPGTRQVVDTIHGHYLQRDVPALVIDAIKSVALPAR